MPEPLNQPRESDVAFLSAFYWPEVRRGTERLVHDLAAGLAGRGRRPLIVTGHPGPTQRSREDGVEVSRVHTLPERLPRRLGYSDRVGHLPALARELRATSPGVAHSFGMFEAAAARLALRRRPSAKVLTVPGIPQRHVIEGLLWRRRALRSAVETSGAIVVISAAAQKQMGWLGGEQRLIYPGVDLSAFARSAERAKQPTLLCAAAPEDPRKRVGLVVEAFRELRSALPQARLILSRRGADPAAGAEPGIEYRDLDSHEAMVRAYSEAWASVLASTSEAFGLVAVESLACGTPVVATSDAGIVEAVGADGLQRRLIERDATDLLQGMREMLERSGDADVEHACLEQAGRFSLEECLDRHEALYAELRAAL